MASPSRDAAKNLERAQLRPFRVAMYAIYIVFTFGFIALVTRSVAREAFGTSVVAGSSSPPTAAGCVKELEGLFGELGARANVAMAPARRPTWDDFLRHFDDRLEDLRTRCDSPALVAPDAVRSDIGAAIAQLGTLRGYIARVGEEGEHESEAMARQLAVLREAVSPKTR